MLLIMGKNEVHCYYWEGNVYMFGLWVKYTSSLLLYVKIKYITHIGNKSKIHC